MACSREVKGGVVVDVRIEDWWEVKEGVEVVVECHKYYIERRVKVKNIMMV
jgi:hypothetical protein